MDIMGKIVENSGTLTAEAMTIGQELKAGIYFIIATDNNNNTQKLKVIKQ
jgi:hypothetical protein